MIYNRKIIYLKKKITTVRKKGEHIIKAGTVELWILGNVGQVHWHCKFNTWYSEWECELWYMWTNALDKDMQI